MHQMKLVPRLGGALLGLCLGAALPAFSQETDPFERRDVLAIQSPSNALTPPNPSHQRLYLDVYNVTDFYDFETNDETGMVDGTWIADTIRPTATLLWDEKFRAQIGVLARKAYGSGKKIDSVDPWLQLLWKPNKPFSVILGSLSYPHAYHDALFMPLNYVRDEAAESGAQLLYQQENWKQDLFFNYRLQDTPAHNEKFDVGFTHNNAWKFLRFNYQVHWIHYGGTLNRHTYATINDIAHLFGVGMQFQPGERWIVGAKYSYLTSKRKEAAADERDGGPVNRQDTRGTGRLYEAYIRYSRVKLGYEYFRGILYQHEGSDPWYTLPKLSIVTLRWDILTSNQFNLFLRYSGGMAGENTQDVSHQLMSAIHLQANWKFSLPICEWTNGAVSGGTPSMPERWDDGV